MPGNEEVCADESAGVKARRHALKDARRTLDEQLREVNDLSRKSWRVLKFNGLVLTISAAFSTYGPFEFPIGIDSALLSLAIISVAYSSYVSLTIQNPEGVKNGPDIDNYQKVTSYDFPEDEYLISTIRSYHEALDQVKDSNADSAKELKKSVFTSVLGTTLLLCSFVASAAL